MTAPTHADTIKEKWAAEAALAEAVALLDGLVRGVDAKDRSLGLAPITDGKPGSVADWLQRIRAFLAAHGAGEAQP